MPGNTIKAIKLYLLEIASHYQKNNNAPVRLCRDTSHVLKEVYDVKAFLDLKRVMTYF